MLTLINIVKNDDIIEADYIPESSNYKAHVILNLLTKEYSAEDIQGYGLMYSRMAVNGLKCTVEELNKGKITDIPKERVVIWY